ncbi:MAG TPA: prolyl oligopeptidase family serine peptidase [Gemmatimonadaceae bacterium]|jgi:dipeptidyl aminopeptidase/acylaminoacyl peptidase
MPNLRLLSLPALALVAGTAAAQTKLASQTTKPKASSKLTIDELIQIKHPSNHQWTPDGSHVWFVYDDGGVNNVWAAPADGSRPAVALTNYPEGQTGAGAFWSKDGQTFFYQKNGGLLAVSANGGTPHAAWPSAARARGFSLSPEGTQVAFLVGQGGGGADAAGAGGGGRGGRGGRGGGGGAGGGGARNAGGGGGGGGGMDLIVHNIATNTDQKIAHADGNIGGMSWSPDGAKLAFTTSAPNGASDLIVENVSANTQSVIQHSDSALGAPSWTPDGANLMYSAGGGGGRGAGPIQHLASPPEVGAKLIFVATEGGRGGGGGETFMVPANGGTPKQLMGGGGRGGRGGNNWIDASHTLATQTSNGGLTRTTVSVNVDNGSSAALHVDTASKFFSSVNTTGDAISPDRRWLLYTSDVTGWDQIYIVPTAGGAPVQLTKTASENWRATWSHDSKRVAWDANTVAKPGTRQIEIATIGDNPASATIVEVTSGSGTNTAPQWSPDDKRILFQHTDYQNSADLYVADAAAHAKVTRLTSSMPASIDKSKLVAPQLIHYPGPDGKPVPAWLFVPKNLDRTKMHPAVVWVHPDGVNQSYDGWHPDRNEAVYYEFHQYLLQQGYVVIAPDYRGSIGYGRDWRNDVYMDVGGNDAKDARLAAKYLGTLGYVDTSRLGIWGLSYGGFITLQTITQEPTWYRAAVDVAGVSDFALYYDDPYHGGWTTSRIGTPTEHPDVYAKAAPMSHVDQIQNPLLILQGTADVNVPFIHTVELVDHLLKAGKGDLMSYMVYPGEFHYFDRSFVVRDAWERVDAFFRKNLKPEATAAANH